MSYCLSWLRNTNCMTCKQSQTWGWTLPGPAWHNPRNRKIPKGLTKDGPRYATNWPIHQKFSKARLKHWPNSIPNLRLMLSTFHIPVRRKFYGLSFYKTLIPQPAIRVRLKVEHFQYQLGMEASKLAHYLDRAVWFNCRRNKPLWCSGRNLAWLGTSIWFRIRILLANSVSKSIILYNTGLLVQAGILYTDCALFSLSQTRF